MMNVHPSIDFSRDLVQLCALSTSRFSFMEQAP